MGKRKIISIDAEKCNGCGLCMPNCPEGAIQMIDGKARLVSDLFCDGLGACIGTCPQGAITVEEREAENYDERRVMENIIPQGQNVILAHLRHLKDHAQVEFLKEALDFLKEKNIPIPADFAHAPIAQPNQSAPEASAASALRQWPIQLHLVSPMAQYFQKKDVLLVADCVGYSLGNFHSEFLAGKSLAIACPKLDSNKDVYVEKVRLLADEAKINTLTAMIMQVPCCRGLIEIARAGLAAAKRTVPLKIVVVGIQGDILSEEWATIEKT
ncbi:MAG TPA: 4Fe-4S binding protein [Candidatus Sumerlaeota bacterium]|nr:MAG: Ferredoxin-3 [candidate division BRC1 bacterium ADurb.Bin183]HOE62791.1 4Fe-4S binding protein [Candidatus Sumerlaeota bacterium]HRR29680.1 4Fe-4S binding protein [Candidatus Sumerlaeia bacterium]HON50349.1 4Fe-4S binding protein [Candidatus Sumerlaeota bacterium]HOR63565.1 4Fe-4S binding protein [Candidatus Sumerlaeota bacterium]